MSGIAILSMMDAKSVEVKAEGTEGSVLGRAEIISSELDDADRGQCSHLGRVGYLGMSPAFVTDNVRMESVKEMHEGVFEVVTISEHPEVAGHLCADFSSARGWNTILGGFFDILCLDYSWIQRDYFYTNYGGKRWFFDPSVPNNKGFVKRFFEWNGRVIVLPLDERGDVWHEFCKYQNLNHFDYQLLQHEACPLVQATRKAEYTKQWAVVPSEFKCKTDRNQRRYLRASPSSSCANNSSIRERGGGKSEEEDREDKDKLAASATHIAFLNPTGGSDYLDKYVNHSKSKFRRMAHKYFNPIGVAAKPKINSNSKSSPLVPPPGVITAVQWVQCDKCRKWRSIPNHVDMESLPESWYCGMNQWDATHNDCRQAEEGTERGDVPVAAVQTSNENMGETLGGVEEEKMVDVLEQEVEDGEEWMQEDLLICIPRNYPPAVVDDSREGTLGGFRHSSPRPKRPTAGSSGSSTKKKSKFKEGVLPLVTVAMQQLPPAGEVMMESWVQCEDRDCRKWHQVSDSVLAAVKDKKVTCGLMALECTKKAKKEEKKDDPPAKWTACAFDTSYMQCVGCGRLSYRRDVLKGKACDVCGKL